MVDCNNNLNKIYGLRAKKRWVLAMLISETVVDADKPQAKQYILCLFFENVGWIT